MTIVSTVPPVIPTPIFVWLKTVSVACTLYPRCCPPHSFVSAWLSRLPFSSFSLSLFTCPYLFWHFVQLLQPLPSLDVHLFPAHVVVYLGRRSQGPALSCLLSCVCNSCMLFPDTMICVTDDSMCCMYAIPGVLSIPFLCLCPTLSLSLLHRSICICLHILICSSILSSCCIASSIEMSISFPHAQCYAADAEVKVLCAENQALWKMHSFKSDSAIMEVGMFRLMPRVLPSYSFTAVFSIYSASLCNSRSQLNVKWHASKGILRTQKLKSPLLRIQSWRMSPH